MAKTKKNDQSTGFPVPYSRDELHRDVAFLLLHHARVTGFIMSPGRGMELLGKEPGSDAQWVLLNPEEDDARLLPYSDVRDTNFARAMEALYDYAYLGVLDQSAESMTHESIYTWVAAFLEDMSASSTLNEWDSYGGQGSDVAVRCRRVAELANARVILEDGESFYYFRSGRPDDDSVAVGTKPALTVRQIALLAAMEEMSIRAAANPRRANPLPTYSDDEGRTRISIEAAKAWLQAKGRYVPIAIRYSRGDIDLGKVRFSSGLDLLDALEARYRFVSLQDDAGGALDGKIEQLGVRLERFDQRVSLALSVDQLADTGFMRRLAVLLELPPDLLALRAREALAREELSKIDRELRSLDAKQKK